MHEDVFDVDDEDPAPPVRFSDDELAFLRHTQYGELPPRVPPEDLVELQETDPPRAEPEDQTTERWIGHPGAI
jgi:hypothetical protein